MLLTDFTLLRKVISYFICISICIFTLVYFIQNLDFNFLFIRSGFDITNSFLKHSSSLSNFHALQVSIINTLIVSACAMIASILISVFCTLLSFIPNIFLKVLIRSMIQLVRNTPLLLQIFFWYQLMLFQLPVVSNSIHFFGFIINNRGFYFPSYNLNALLIVFSFGTGLVILFKIYRSFINYHNKSFLLLISLVSFTLVYFILPSPSYPEVDRFNVLGGGRIYPEFIGLFLGLTIYTSAFLIIVIQNGFNSIPKAQIESAKALGFNLVQRVMLIFLPISMPHIIPPSLNLLLNQTKDSSLGVVIGFPEIVSVFAGTVLNQTGKATEIIFITMLVYMFINLSFSLVVNLYNRKIRTWYAP